jgi:hypothetical protein
MSNPFSPANCAPSALLAEMGMRGWGFWNTLGHTAMLRNR